MEWGWRTVRARMGTGTRGQGARPYAARLRLHTAPPTRHHDSASTRHSTTRTDTAPPFAARTVHTSSPSSSFLGVARPTGTTFQYRLVGVPGGAAVRVCQGAPVRAPCLGRCWVRVSLAARRAMGLMAGAGNGPAVGDAMVEWDGVLPPQDAVNVTVGPFRAVPTSAPHHAITACNIPAALPSRTHTPTDPATIRRIADMGTRGMTFRHLGTPRIASTIPVPTTPIDLHSPSVIAAWADGIGEGGWVTKGGAGPTRDRGA